MGQQKCPNSALKCPSSSSAVEKVPQQPKKAPSKTTVACDCTVASVACNGTMAEFVWQQVSCPLAHRRPDDSKEIVFSTLGSSKVPTDGHALCSNQLCRASRVLSSGMKHARFWVCEGAKCAKFEVPFYCWAAVSDYEKKVSSRIKAHLIFITRRRNGKGDGKGAAMSAYALSPNCGH